MALAALSVVAFGSIGWSLWVRRLTWRSRWEAAATLNVALQGVAPLLMSNPRDHHHRRPDVSGLGGVEC
jgi:hypothetical protein